MAPSQQLKLWELAGDNANLSFSPFVWRVRLTLAYKGLPYEYKAWRFSDKELIQPCKTVSHPSHAVSSMQHLTCF